MKTNKLLIIAMLLGAVSVTTFAQKKVEVGVLGGYSYTIPKISTVSINDNLNGFHVGPVIKFNIKNQVGIQTGVYYNYFSGVYISQGMLALKKATGTWEQSRTTLGCLDIPLQVVYTMPIA